MVVGLTFATIAILGDFTSGEIADRRRTFSASDHITLAYPSGHVFGSEYQLPTIPRQSAKACPAC